MMNEVIVLMPETSADGHCLRTFDEVRRENEAVHEPSLCLHCGKVYLLRRKAVRA